MNPLEARGTNPRFAWKPWMARRPSDQIWRVLERLSRDRYLCPKEVQRIGMAVARKVSNAPCHSFAAATRCGEAVGIWRGRPIAALWEEVYLDALRIAEKYGKKPTADCSAELEILKLRARQNSINEYHRRTEERTSQVLRAGARRKTVG